MSKRTKNLITLCVAAGLIASIGGPAEANWLETFGGNSEDQAWTWGCYPDLTGTFAHPIIDGPGDDDYVRLDETTSSDLGGSQFGMGFAGGDFADVRVGAVVNVAGNNSRNYSGIAARINYFVDDGSQSGYPGIIATGAYILMYHWEDGPLRVRIEVLKAFMNSDDIHKGDGTFMPEVPVPGLGSTHYVELDVVGSDPVYVTASIYEYKGGPLLVRTPTMVDTGGRDPWEDSALPPAHPVFPAGKSGVFAINRDPSPVGYHVTFDTVSSTSEGPSAVCLGPEDGATDVDIDADLEWAESTSTTSRQLWFGKEGAMRPYNPSGTTYDPGTLEVGQTYQWRVDQIGPGGSVEGHVFTFTTEGTAEGCLLIDDFESYYGDGDLRPVWPDDIDIWDYTYLETVEVYAGAQALRFEYQNQYEPYITRVIHTFAEPQDWAKAGLAVLSLNFRGDEDNVEQKLFIALEDNLGHSFEVANPYNNYAVLTELWQTWSVELSEFGNNGVDLSQVKKISIRTGDGVNTGQPLDVSDKIYIDEVRICPLRCSLNSNADLDGSCRIDFGDFSAIANEWLNEGEYVLP